MIALDFARQHLNFILITSPAHTFFFIWLADEEELLYYYTSWFKISLSECATRAESTESQPRSCFPVCENFRPNMRCLKVFLFYRTISLLSWSRTYGRFAMIVCYKLPSMRIVLTLSLFSSYANLNSLL